jgi:excisionase family DNA binding protein
VNPTTRSAYLNATEVAERLHASTKTVSRWAKAGRLAHQRTLGGHRRDDPAQVDQLARELALPAAEP